MIFFVFLAIILFTPLFFGGDVWWVKIPLQIIILAMFFLNHNLIKEKIKNQKKFRPLFYGVIALFIILIFSTINSVNLNYSLTFFTYILTLFICFLFSYWGDISERKIKILTGTIILSANFQVTIMGLQLLNILTHNHWNPSKFPAGTFYNHNHLGALLGISLTLSVAYFVSNNKGVLKEKIFYLSSMILQLFGLIMTASRGALLSTLIGVTVLVVISYQRFNLKKVSILFLTLLITFAVAFQFNFIKKRGATLLNLDKDSSLKSRVLVWKNTLDIIRDNPLLGTGPGTFSVIIPKYRDKNNNCYINMPHNQYLCWMSDCGIPALLVIIFIISCFLYILITHFNKKEHMLIAMIAIMVSVLIHSLVDYSIRIPAVAYYLVILSGLTLRRL